MSKFGETALPFYRPSCTTVRLSPKLQSSRWLPPTTSPFTSLFLPRHRTVPREPCEFPAIFVFPLQVLVMTGHSPTASLSFASSFLGVRSKRPPARFPLIRIEPRPISLPPPSSRPEEPRPHERVFTSVFPFFVKVGERGFLLLFSYELFRSFCSIFFALLHDSTPPPFFSRPCR